MPFVILHVSQGATHLGVQVITVLLSYGADINATDEDGQTPLQYALLCDHQQVKFSSYQRKIMCIVMQVSKCLWCKSVPATFYKDLPETCNSGEMLARHMSCCCVQAYNTLVKAGKPSLEPAFA